MSGLYWLLVNGLVNTTVDIFSDTLGVGVVCGIFDTGATEATKFFNAVLTYSLI
jgi:hypothetical protein